MGESSPSKFIESLTQAACLCLLFVLFLISFPFFLLWGLIGTFLFRFVSRKVWLPAGAAHEDMLKAEQEMIKNFASLEESGLSVESKVVAGLGTLLVSSPSHDSIVASSKTLVLIHGYFGGNAYYAPCLAHLSKKFKVICVEMRGWGVSDRPYHKENRRCLRSLL
jgi:pimeloyl-ACP methyl ester carboxylesterase